VQAAASAQTSVTRRSGTLVSKFLDRVTRERLGLGEGFGGGRVPW
jgi:hypothetical protein